MTQQRRIFVGGTTLSALAIVLSGLGFSGTAHATPKPIRVWVYGDGETSRMYSELQYLLTTGLTVVPKNPMDSTGPDNPVGSYPNLMYRVYYDFVNAPSSSRPDVIHIGYNASANSYWYCATNPNWNDPNDPNYYVNVAWKEANAIKDAADEVLALGKKVLVSKGPGVPNNYPISECLNDAFDAVTYFLAYLAPNKYPYVDYSGYDPGTAGGSVDPALVLDRNTPALWQTDRVHVSCDKAHFEPGTDYSNTYCNTVTTQTQRQLLGSWRVAKTVLKAYQYFQR